MTRRPGSPARFARVILFGWCATAAPVVGATFAARLPARPQTRGVSRVRMVCVLEADPRNMFTRVPPPARFTTRAFAADAVPITVSYTGFTPAAQAAFQYAVNIWQSQLTSSVPIRVNAKFTVLSGSTLGSAGATEVFRDFSGALSASTWYAKALANRLAGTDLDSTAVDITARFNSNFTWYYGTDGVTPAGQYDFVSVVLHELAHGLGFFGTMDVSGGTGAWGWGTGYPHVYDRFIENGTGQALLNPALFPNPSTALATQLTGGALYWNGANARAANGTVKPRIYAPATWAPGSSYSHVDEATYPAGSPNSLMTYAIGAAEAIHDPGPIVRGIFIDEGWSANGCAYVLTPSSASYGAAGGAGTITVATGSACSWSASSSVFWIAVTAGATGLGSGSVGYTVAANTSSSGRAGVLMVGTQGVSVAQAGSLAPTRPTGVRIIR